VTSLADSNEPQEDLEGTVFIVDDDPDVRKAVMLLVSSAGLAAEGYASGDEFLKRFDPQRPGCIILDVRMPGMSGLELQKVLDLNRSRPPIIFITAHGELPLATEAIRTGAIDFLQKPVSPPVLLERIQEALSLDRECRCKRAEAAGVQERLTTLTARELEIAKLLASGKSTKQIAHELEISSKTVDNHRAKILEKMGVDNPTQLARLLDLLNQ